MIYALLGDVRAAEQSLAYNPHSVIGQKSGEVLTNASADVTID